MIDTSMAATLRALWTFLAVADAGGVSAGARRIGLAQSTVSGAIRDLERDIGGALFEITTLGLRPTEIGAKLRTIALSTALETEQALADLHAGKISHEPPVVVIVSGPAAGSLADWAVIGGALDEAWRAGTRTSPLVLSPDADAEGSGPDIRVRYELGVQEEARGRGCIKDDWRLLTPGAARDATPIDWRALGSMRAAVASFSAKATDALLGAAPWLRAARASPHGAHHGLQDHETDALLIPASALGAGLSASGLRAQPVVGAPVAPWVRVEVARESERALRVACSIAHRMRLATQRGAVQPRLRALDLHADLHCLQCFTATVETGATTRAAVALKIAQPALSVQIRKLEHAVKRSLFDRSSAGMTATAAGTRLFDMARPLLGEHGEAMAHLREQAAGGDTRRVRLGLIPPASEGSLVARAAAETIGAWRAAHPLSGLSVIEGFSGDQIRWLRNQRVDIAIIDTIDHEPGLEITPILSEPMMLVISTDSPWARETGPIPARRLAEIELVIPSRRFGLRRITERALAADGLKLRPAVEVDGFAVTLRLLRSGGFGAVLPASAVGEEIAGGRLVARTIIEPRSERRLCLAVRAGGARDETTRRLGEMIAGSFLKLRRAQAASL